MEEDSSLSFRLMICVFVVVVECMNVMIQANLGLDLKEGPKVHLVLLLGLSIHDSLLGIVLVPWTAHYNNPDPTVCTCLVFLLRLCMMGSVTFVTLLALERFLSLVAPFWYNLQVNVKRAVVTSLIVPVALSSLDVVFLFEDSLVEIQDTTSNTTFTECQNIPGTSIALILAVCGFLSVVLHLIFNVTFIKKLFQLRRTVNAVGGSDVRDERSEEVVLLRLVLALCVISVVTIMPVSAFALWRYVHAQTASAGRLTLSLVSGVGMLANPVAFLMCTARYRRRLRCCFLRVVRAIGSKCGLGAMQTSDTTECSTSECSRSTRSHADVTELTVTGDVPGLSQQSISDAEVASTTGPRTSGPTTEVAEGKAAGLCTPQATTGPSFPESVIDVV